jgi:plastocyanin
MKKLFAGLPLAALLAAGCGGNAATPGIHASGLSAPALSAPAGTASSISPDTAIVVGIRLDPQNPLNDPRYGFVLGYFKGVKTHQSHVVFLPMGSNVKFSNVEDNDVHTASFLGKATAHSAPWPSSFNGSATKSPAGTAIGTATFSTGPLNPGKTSAVYNTGLPGFYMIGCAFHYDSNMMRTVIVVR